MKHLLRHIILITALLLLAAPCSFAAVTADEPKVNKDFSVATKNVKNRHNSVATGSSVNTVTRDYERDQEDISAVIPGGRLSVHRYYENDAWHWSHNRNNLGFSYDGSGAIISITKAGVEYKGSNTNPDLFNYDTQRILRTQDGFKWQNPKDDWIEYDGQGRMLSYGSRTRTTAIALYDGDHCTGFSDASGTRIFWFEYVGDNLSAVSDAADRLVSYTYEGDLLKTVTNLRGYVTTFSYTNGLLTRVEEPGGKIRNIKYNPYGDVVSVTDDDGVGHFFEFDYDKGTREYYAYTRFPSGKVKEVWYDQYGDTKRVDINGTTVQSIKSDVRTQWVTDARGLVTRQDLDEWDNILRTVYPDDTWEERTYQQPGNLLLSRNRMGIIATYEYDDKGDRIAMNEAVGTSDERRTEYTYTAEGTIKTLTVKGKTEDQDATTTYNYDLTGHLISIVDPENRTTTFSNFDHAGNPQTIVDGRGYNKHLEYDAAGNVRFVRDHNNKLIAEYRYDKAGNRDTTVDAYLKEYSYVYDPDNNLISVIDPLESESTRTYNEANKPIQIIDEEGHPLTYEYDLFERLVKTIDGEGNTTVYEYATAEGCASCSGGSNLISKIIYPTFIRELSYDERGRVVSQTDSFDDTQRTATFTYDKFGNSKTVTDAENHTTTYSYDNLGRVVSGKTADDGITVYRYDNRNNLIQITDANDGVTLFSYDRSDRLLTEVIPLLQSITYSYDQAGNLKSQIDSNGRKTVYIYDENNRLVKTEIYINLNATTPYKTITYTYNDTGRLTGYDDGITSTVYSYDDLQRRTSEIVDYGRITLSQRYGYYKNSRKKTYTDPAGRTRTWNYDTAGRPTGLDLEAVGQVSITGYRWNLPTVISLPGGSKLTYTYNGMKQLLSVQGSDPGDNIVLNHAYSYTPAGNVDVRTTEHGIYDYDYDQSYRLIKAEQPGQEEQFSYDYMGNRLTSVDWTNWDYNANNQLNGYDNITFDYDNQGNMTGKTVDATTTSYHYSVDNRLQRVETEGGNVLGQYYYDPFGRRLWKEVGGIRTYFLYNDEGLVGEYDATETELRTYGYKPGSPWSSNPLFVQEAGKYYWYLNDHLGTPQKLMAENGTVVWSAVYDSFGRANVQVGDVENNLRFPGQYFDTETGLHYNWNRYYDPESGRYNTVDPIRIDGGANYYAYSKNNALSYIDPQGLKYCDKCDECPGGKWKGSTPPAGGVTVAAGYLTSVDIVYWHCTSSAKTCFVNYLCKGFKGIALTASVDLVTNCWASGACSGSDLGGESIGKRGDIPLPLYVGVTYTETESSSGVKTKCVGASAGVGVTLLKIKCKSYHNSCDF